MLITSENSIGRREYNEDRFIVNNENGLFIAVFDGHGGDEVAENASQNIFKFWNEIQEENISQKLKNLFDRLAEEYQNNSVGSTVSVVFVPNDSKDAYVAVLGDSPVLVYDSQNQKVHVSPEHNVRTHIEDRQELINKNAQVTDGYYLSPKYQMWIQLTRSIGDADFRGLIKTDPDIYTRPIHEGDWILVGTDGVFDPGHKNTEESVQNITKMVNDGENAQEIMKIIKPYISDNATLVLARF